MVTAENDLVHRYKMEQNGNDSVGNRDADLVNNPSFTTSSQEGDYALVADESGQEYIDPGNGDLNVDATSGGGLCYVFWAYFHDAEADEGVVSVNDANANWYGFFTSNGTFSSAYRSSGNNPNVSMSVNSGQWYSIGIQYDSGTMEVWRNGSRQDTNSSGDALDNKVSDAGIGAQPGQGRYSDCRIDDFRVYTRPLSSSEHTSIYEGDTATVPTAPSNLSATLQ